MSTTMQGGDPTKVIGRRFGAFVIDWVILGAVVPLLIFLAVSQPTVYTDEPGCPVLESMTNDGVEVVPTGDYCAEVSIPGFEGTYVYPDSGAAAASIFQFLYLVGVLWIVQGISGMTVGKLLFGIRTVNQSGTGPGIGKQFIRGVLWLVDGLCGLPIIAAGFILATKRHQRLGDLAAGTFVVRSSARGFEVPAAGATVAAAPLAGGVAPTAYPAAPPSGTSPYPAGPPMSTAAPDFTSSAPGAPVAPRPPAGFGGLTGVAPAADTPVDPDATTTLGATSFTSPDGDATTVQPAVSDAAATPPTGGPQWDPARNAYIQWDEARQSWLAYDDAAGEWKTIS